MGIPWVSLFARLGLSGLWVSQSCNRWMSPFPDLWVSSTKWSYTSFTSERTLSHPFSSAK
jgi:hypothetical protein